eukprot:14382135-Heterocapsa_arctica.AAC.1
MSPHSITLGHRLRMTRLATGSTSHEMSPTTRTGNRLRSPPRPSNRPTQIARGPAQSGPSGRRRTGVDRGASHTPVLLHAPPPLEQASEANTRPSISAR